MAVIVGALAALAGAAVGAYIAHTLALRREQGRREAELKGILRLLDYDRHHINGQLKQFRDKPTWITDAPSEVLRVTAWEETRIQLSHLLNDEAAFADMIKFLATFRL